MRIRFLSRIALVLIVACIFAEQNASLAANNAVRRYCGAGACELLAKRLGLKLSREGYAQIRKLPEVSLGQIADVFESEELLVEKYQLDPRSEFVQFFCSF